MLPPQTLTQDEGVLRADRDNEAETEQEAGGGGSEHGELPLAMPL
ncbi:MAG: hypothetical protein U5N27_22240 [Rhizobium sp.]|nr:hypothetical protein [Rhizobium sp.]